VIVKTSVFVKDSVALNPAVFDKPFVCFNEFDALNGDDSLLVWLFERSFVPPKAFEAENALDELNLFVDDIDLVDENLEVAVNPFVGENPPDFVKVLVLANLELTVNTAVEIGLNNGQFRIVAVLLCVKG
jgi:hypothetical protein